MYLESTTKLAKSSPRTFRLLAIRGLEDSPIGATRLLISEPLNSKDKKTKALILQSLRLYSYCLH